LVRMVAHIDKAAFTRADLVEWVGALLPVDAPGDPRALIEQIVDMVGLRVSAPREAYHREGHELFTLDAVIAEETRIFHLIDAVDNRARLDMRAADLAGLSADQARAIVNIAASPYLVQPLQAPAGAGKTHSLQALRAAAHRATVLMLGAGGISEVDLTPIWYKEVALIGAIDHTVDTGSAPGLAGGSGRHSVDRALDVLAAGLLPDDVVVTHEFSLDDARLAVETAIDRANSHAIKVVFRP